MKRAVIFAHFDPHGEVPAHTRRLIELLRRRSQRFILVSTGLSADCARTLPDDVEVIIRDNVGYDFMSYKTGWQRLGDTTAFDEVLIVNDSIYLAEPARLEQTLADLEKRDVDAWGLTASQEGGFHLQSFFFGFRRRALSHSCLADFWDRVEVLQNKQDIIRRYEKGLSQTLLANGLQVEAAYLGNSTRALFLMAQRKAQGQPVRTLLLMIRTLLQPRRRGNPMHFLWDQVLLRQGILKLELLKRNPRGIDLRTLEHGLSAAGLQALQDARIAWQK